MAGMLTVILATSTSALFGLSDFLGGLASRRDSAFAVTATAHLIGAVLFSVAVFVWVAPYGARDLVWGALAGVSGGVGVTALYAALARGRMGVVAPITAALSGGLPAAFDLLRGTRIPASASIGLVLALVAIAIVSMGGDEEERRAMPPAALGLALLAGVGFAGALLSFAQTGHASGLVPLVAARVTSASLIGGIALARLGTLRLGAGAARCAYAAGLLDSAANVTMLTAIRTGPLAVASVLGSLYPVVTILLARTVLGERLRGVQRAGVGLALAAVVLTAVR